MFRMDNSSIENWNKKEIDKFMNDNESLRDGMRLLGKNAYVRGPFEVSNGEVCAGKSGVCQSD